MTNAAWMKRLQQVEVADCTYQACEPPLVFAKAQGSKIVDAEGRSYIDLCAGFGVMALGHAHPAVQQIFAAQATNMPPIVHGMGDVYPSTDKIELLETVQSLLPSYLTKGALAISGGQAVEVALKTAMLKTKASGVICFRGGYHGLDLGLLPVVSRQDFKKPFQGWVQSDNICELPFSADLQVVEKAIQKLAAGSFGFAAIIVEPVQGRSGIKPAGTAWLKGLKELAQRYQGLLIFDEIFCGLGRTGRWSFTEVVPADITCLGKALGGGMPLSVCFGSESAMSAWPLNHGEAIHTGTFFGHPLACRLATTTLKHIASEKLLSRAAKVGATYLTRLQEKLSGLPVVKDVRGIGLMMAVEFTQPGAGVTVMHALREQGVIALVSGEQGQSLSITPALNIPETLLDRAWEQLAQVIASHLTA